MKKLLLIALALTGLTVNAQYFHHIYGTTDGEKLSSGLNTTTLGLGHFLVGHAGQNGLAVSRTDVNGDVTGAPYFNGWYQISSSVTGTIVDVAESKCFEMDNGAGFGIVGQFTDPSMGTPNTGVFYLQLDPMGNVVNIFTYLPGGGVAFNVRNVSSVAESVMSGGNEVYVTGSTADASGTRLDAFAMKLDVNSGGLIWSAVYDINLTSGSGLTSSWDIIESPYANEVVLAGGIREPVFGSRPDGFTLRLDANSGNPVANVDLYGTAANTDEFYSISVAASTAGGGDGFVLGGRSDFNGSIDAWVTKVDQNLVTLWTSVFDYNAIPGVENVCHDVIERLNTSGVYEYYAAGYVRGGLFGSYDIVVEKMDDNGVGVSLGEFTYGDARVDYGVAIDQYDGTGSDGISVFGFREGATPPIINGNYDMYLVKAYFNGETPCNQKLVDSWDLPGPKIYNNAGVGIVDNINPDVQFNWNIAGAHDRTICFSPFLSSGSNARVAPTETGDKQAVVSPNPIQAGSNVVEVTIETEIATTAQVAIYDVLGREYYNGAISLAKGTNTMPIDISKANMSAGTYSVRINYNNTNKTILLMVK